MDTMESMMFNFTLLPTEYIDGDMIYCKNCKEPKIFDFGGRKVRCICSCEEEADRQHKLTQQKILQQQCFESLQKASLLGERYRDVSFDKTIIDENTDKTFLIAFNRCRKYCDNYLQVLSGGYGMYIWGANGTGKTHLTACIVNELAKNMESVLFTNFYKIVEKLREKKTNILDKLASIPFLIFDDVGSEQVKFNGEDNWVQEQIYQIINHRYNEKKPTIFTSNYSISELLTKQGLWRKTVDRIYEMSSAVLEVKGKSYRTTKKEKDIPF